MNSKLTLTFIKRVFLIVVFINVAGSGDTYSTAFSQQLTSGNMIAWFPFNGSAEEIIGSHKGMLNGPVLTTDRFGNANSAYLFNGISDNISFADADVFSFPDNHFSISSWVYVVDTLNFMAILSKRGIHGPFEYSIDNAFGKSSFNFDNWVESGNGTVYGPDPLKAKAKAMPNEGVHLVYTADGDTLRVYKNGIRVGGVDLRQPGKTASNTVADLAIGVGGGWDKSYYFKGKIDDIRFYNYALRQSEIDSMYNEPTGIADLTDNSDFIIYPNPASDIINMNVVVEKVSVTDAEGIEVKEFANGKSFNIEEIPAGIYFMKIISGKKTYLKKLVKL